MTRRRIKPPLRLGILTAVWKRPELTRAVLGYYASLKIRDGKRPVVSLTCIAAASEPVEAEGWTIVETPNEPLGAKWNAGLRAFEDTDVEAVMIVGSDDLVSESYIRLVADHIDRHAYIQPDDMYLYDTQTNRCVLAAPFPGGAGRVVRRDVLETLRWKLWDNVDRYLDSSMSRRVETQVSTSFCPSHLRHGICILDVKTGENMWRLHPSENRMSGDGREIAVHVAKEVDGRKLIDRHFPGFQI